MVEPTEEPPSQDADAASTDWDPAAAAPESAAPWRRYVKWILVGLFALAVTGQVVQLIAGTTRAPAPTPLDYPPVGSIWFGSGFDPTTYGIDGEPFTTVALNQPFSFVAHVPRIVDASDMVLTITLDGQAVSSAPVAGASGDLWAFSDTATSAGSFEYQLVDTDGKILATGRIVAH